MKYFSFILTNLARYVCRSCRNASVTAVVSSMSSLCMLLAGEAQAVIEDGAERTMADSGMSGEWRVDATE